MTLQVLTGVTQSNCTSGYGGVGDLWHVAIRFDAWRIDDGPVEQGRLAIESDEVPKTYVTGFNERVPNESVVRVQVRAVDDGWQFVEILETGVSDDQELLDLALARQAASPPNHPSDLAKVVPTALVQGGEGTLERFMELVAEGSKNFTLTGRGQLGGRLDSPLGAVDVPVGTAQPYTLRVQSLANGHTARVTVWAGDSAQQWERMTELFEAFSHELGEPAATTMGLEYWRAPAEFLVPDIHRNEPYVVDGVGEYVPTYEIKVDSRKLEVGYSGHQGPWFEISVLGGRKMRFEIDWRSDPETDARAAEAALAATAIQNFVAAGPEVLSEAAPYMHRYYLAIREGFSDDECREMGVPVDVTPDNVWDHIGLGNTAQVRANPGSEDPHRHPNSAYITFGGACTWEEEHGIGLSFLNGNRISYVGPAGAPVTLAAAYADPEKLDGVVADY